MAITLAQAKDMLDRYVKAEQEVLEGKTVIFSGRSLTMVDLPDLRAGRQEWERKVAKLQRAAAGGSGGYKLATFE